MKVILRPLMEDSWSGISKYRNCHEDIAPYFTRSGRIYTGLREVDAKRLGEKLNLDLSPSSDYWINFAIRTSGKDIYFLLEDPLDELKYLFLRNHKRVKKSMFEHKATAGFALINENEEAKKANVHNKAKRQAIRELDKMSNEDIKKALRIYGKRSESLSAEMAENALFTIVEGDPQGFIDKWVHNQSRETQYLIERAIGENIIRRNKRQYTYGTEVIGHGIEDAIAYLEDPKNQELRMTIKYEIDAKGKLSDAVSQEEEFEDTPKEKEKLFKSTKSSKPMDEDQITEVDNKPEVEKTTKKTKK